MSVSQSTTRPAAQVPTPPSLVDEQGPIPTFPPRQFDEHGRLVPISDDERRARAEANARALRVIFSRPDNDPPGVEREMMRGIDENRGPGRKLFEGMY